MTLKNFGRFAREKYLPAGDLAFPIAGVFLINADHPVYGALALSVGALNIYSSYGRWKRGQDKAPAETLREPQDKI
jgi:hypothetical protein